jgi:hypothetical protein
MADYQSAEEVEQEHLRAFGPTLGRLYHELYNEVTWVHAKWLQYRELYAKSEKRIELLNQTAALFFRIVQDALWENVLLHIARLTDPPVQGEFKNLTLQCLPDAVGDQVLAGDLRNLVEAGLNRSQFAREWRNKRLAHNDLSLAVDAKAARLPGVSRQNVEDALASFRQIMNRMYGAFFQSEVAFEHFVTDGSADALVYRLAVAARLDEHRSKRFRQGKPLPEDLEPIPEA